MHLFRKGSSGAYLFCRCCRVFDMAPRVDGFVVSDSSAFPQFSSYSVNKFCVFGASGEVAFYQ